MRASSAAQTPRMKMTTPRSITLSKIAALAMACTFSVFFVYLAERYRTRGEAIARMPNVTDLSGISARFKVGPQSEDSWAAREFDDRDWKEVNLPGTEFSTQFRDHLQDHSY